MIDQSTTRQSEPHLVGLTSAEALKRFQIYGPNEIPAERKRPWLVFVQKMWGPVPWMLEITVLLELFLGKWTEAGIIALLVLFNAWISSFQENRAQDALSFLRQRLTVNARVLRDGQWQIIPARELVMGDIIHVRMGDLAPADMQIKTGQVLVDRSTLTGESLPVENGEGSTVYAGTILKRGEATGEVIATGRNTSYGKTAELVRLAKTSGTLNEIVYAIVRDLIFLDGGLAAVVLLFAIFTGLAWQDFLPFAIILLIASVPVALPVTFTVATAVGALELAGQGALVTRLGAIEEAAGMDVLCTDKTGTITENHLKVTVVKPYFPFKEEETLRLAALASSDATQDPLDLAVLNEARTRGLLVSPPANLQFTPFDPDTKRSEAVFEEGQQSVHVIKGAASAISALNPYGQAEIDSDVEAMAGKGLRMLAVATGHDDQLAVAGLIGFQDPPRSDSGKLIQELHDLGVKVVMVTGDGQATARAIAAQIGLVKWDCGENAVQAISTKIDPDCEVFAEVLPEDKYNLVKTFQRFSHIVGMTGDGVNDAPALRQAEVGIAVSNATDVAKASASLVLTNAGLGNIISAIQVSRQIYQRMLTYTLNKIIKTIVIVLFMSLSLIIFRTFVTTSILIILLLFTNDFVTMSIATDRVRYSKKPNRWQIRTLVTAALGLAIPILVLLFGLFWFGSLELKLSLGKLQTMLFLALVFSGQGAVYLVRERRHLWSSTPGQWMMLATILDFILVGFLATQGILMIAIPLSLVLFTLVVILLFLVLLDFWKVRLFKSLKVE
ncbi:MAG TPA: plasma-membrane proton-efflux P-type ATPase [Anaerolineaceae bacterium]|nr:plasma-membrane proton-efflux P-type ATPase [Anaerolineaceae bacterium]